jgi:Zn-dependent peptidase ImmA (M78 family)
MNVREQTVRRCAIDLLAEVEFSAPPVDPSAIALTKGIRLDIAPGFPRDVYGALYLDSHGFGIMVSADCHGQGHRSFTVGHELGHYHIDGHVDAMFPEGVHQQVLSHGGHFRDRKRREEREADWFASELLMPTRWTEPRACSLSPNLEAIRSLADEFRVSLCCAAIRYAELTDEAVAVIVSKGGEVEWAVTSRRISEHEWGKRVLRREWIPRGTPTRLLVENVTGRGTEHVGSCYLCEWFEGAPDFVIAQEEALDLGDYGRVLTILYADRLQSADEAAEEDGERNWRQRDWRDAMRGYSLD